MMNTITAVAQAWPCNCMGPQNGQPKCPCQMRGVVQRDGRWIEPERDLGPVRPSPPDIPFHLQTTGAGCVCPAGAEKTCMGPMCPRRPIVGATA